MNFHLTADQLFWQELLKVELLDSLSLRDLQSELIRCEELGGQVVAQMIMVQDAEDEGNFRDQNALKASHVR